MRTKPSPSVRYSTSSSDVSLRRASPIGLPCHTVKISVLPNSNCVEVEVLLFRIDLEYMLPCTEIDAALSDKLEGVPVAGIGCENRAGDVHLINFDVEPAIGEFTADLGFNSIGPRPADPDGVLKPFASLDI